jgi:nucleotide-binding universal stress UspA family protein
MERALAVVEGNEATKELVREAGELAAGVGAELDLLHVTTEDEFDEQVDALAGIPEHAGAYGSDNARDGAESFARDIGKETLADIEGLEWRAIGALGEKAPVVIEVAEDEGCDHIFLSGQKRSPAGKALFGDVTQEVILNFDGAVTVTTH